MGFLNKWWIIRKYYFNINFLSDKYLYPGDVTYVLEKYKKPKVFLEYTGDETENLFIEDKKVMTSTLPKIFYSECSSITNNFIFPYNFERQFSTKKNLNQLK